MTLPRSQYPLWNEQWRRMRHAWAMDQPEPDEIHRAYQRWNTPIAKRTPGRVRPAWLLVAAMSFIGGGALAVTGVLRPVTSTKREVPPSASVTAPVSGAPRMVSVRPSQPPAAPIDSDDSDDSKLDIAAAPIEESGPTASTTRPVASRPTMQSSARAVPAVPKEQVDVGSWSQVADAMRQGDAQRVRRALEELSHSDDAATRDAARLTRAQLEIAAGHPERARSELSQLAGSGATPLVRHRAKEMLLRLAE